MEKNMPKIIKMNHVAIAVADINQALEFWEKSLGIKLDRIEEVLSQKAKVAFLPVDGSEIELIQPTADDTGTARFIQSRGGGMHHLCFEVDDIAGMLADLKEKGVRLINEEPLEAEGRKMAFIHPKSANGVLVELYQLV
jgi:methylmalonyl-CoA/ethylmalonyl-CoA epimerase